MMSCRYSTILAVIAVSSYISVPIDGCTRTTTGPPVRIVVLPNGATMTMAATTMATATTTAAATTTAVATTLQPCIPECVTTAVAPIATTATLVTTEALIPCTGTGAAVGQTANVNCPLVQPIMLEGASIGVNSVMLTCTATGWQPMATAAAILSTATPLACM